MIDECLSEFDYSDGLEGLEDDICKKISLKIETPEDAISYVNENKEYETDYPDIIKEKIQDAFEKIMSLDRDEIKILKELENEDSGDEGSGIEKRKIEAPGKALQIRAPYDCPALNIINDCLEGITEEKVDVVELSYSILEALIRKHGTKADILDHKEDYESIIPLFHQSVGDALKSAFNKLEILSENQVAEIRRIIES